jgi:translation initiation factor IF-3
MARTDLGAKLLRRVAEDVGERGVVESTPEMAGNRMHMIMGPSKQQLAAKKGAEEAVS